MSDERSPWQSRGTRFAMFVNIFGGLLVGFTIGYLPVMLQYNQYFGECSRYTTRSACDGMTDAGCEWVPFSNASDAGICGYPDHAGVNCSSNVDVHSCKANSKCYWKYHDDVCEHRVGWSPNQQGMLAGAQILGAMASSPFAGPLTNRFGRRWSLLMSSLVALVASIFFTAGWAMQENYGMLLAAEFIVGLAVGWLQVICPMYCGEMAARQLEETIGVMFQIALTLGILLAATLGLIFDPRNATAEYHGDLQVRLQYITAVQWIVAALLVPLSRIMPESALWKSECKAAGMPLMTEGGESSPHGRESASHSASHTKPSIRLFRRELLIPLLVGVALASAQQLTGINSVMIYGPQLAGQIGLQPLVGNFFIMLWNFLTCLLSIPLSQRVKPRKMYINSTGVATIACLITGIAVFPGILGDESTQQQVLTGFGILAFVAAFECGIGPCFYVLAQDTFPEEVRSAGTSYTVWVQFVFNVIINWGFPVAMTGFSGGPSGNQNQGMAICFLLFAFIGVVTTLFLYLKMPMAQSELRDLNGSPTMANTTELAEDSSHLATQQAASTEQPKITTAF